MTMSLYRKKQFWDRLIGEDWSSLLFRSVLDTKNMEEIMNTIDGVYTLSKSNPKLVTFPKKKNIFKAFRLCPVSDLKLIIVGQDPYKNSKATGVALANPKSTLDNNISPPLEAVMDALERCYPGEGTSMDKSMEFWAKQGVLLLNSSLTVGKSSIVSHTVLWRDFTAAILKELTAGGGCIVILLGHQARSFRKHIDEYTYVIELPHPSFCAQEKLPFRLDFIDLNKSLIMLYGRGITWIEGLPLNLS